MSEEKTDIFSEIDKEPSNGSDSGDLKALLESINKRLDSIEGKKTGKSDAKPDKNTDDKDELTLSKEKIAKEKEQKELLKREAQSLNKISALTERFKDNEAYLNAFKLVQENESLTYSEQLKRIEKLVLDDLLKDEKIKEKAHLIKDLETYDAFKKEIEEKEELLKKAKTLGNMGGFKKTNEKSDNPLLNKMRGIA